jgi:signal peptidase I
MNIEEIKKKYGDVKLRFVGYYKYSFSFAGKTDDNEKICVSVGGTPGDIYRMEIRADKEETLYTLHPNHITVTKDNVCIVNWFDAFSPSLPYLE